MHAVIDFDALTLNISETVRDSTLTVHSSANTMCTGVGLLEVELWLRQTKVTRKLNPDFRIDPDPGVRRIVRIRLQNVAYTGFIPRRRSSFVKGFR